MSNGDNPEVKQMLEAVAPPESQFSLNWQMIDGFGGNVQVTMRAAWIGEWPDIMRERKEFCNKAQEAGWTFPGSIRPQPAPTAAAPVAPPNGTPAAHGNGVLVLNASELRVTPRADGKADLEFWNAGRQFAEIKATKAPADAVKMLSGAGTWTPDNFTKAGAFTLPVLIEYRLSEKLNSKGNPYKDILAIRPV